MGHHSWDHLLWRFRLHSDSVCLFVCFPKKNRMCNPPLPPIIYTDWHDTTALMGTPVGPVPHQTLPLATPLDKNREIKKIIIWATSVTTKANSSLIFSLTTTRKLKETPPPVCCAAVTKHHFTSLLSLKKILSVVGRQRAGCWSLTSSWSSVVTSYLLNNKENQNHQN